MNPLTVFGKVKKDGERPVYVQLFIKGKNITLKTGVSVNPEQWDKDKGLIKGKSKEISDNNLIIQNVRSRVNQILVKYKLSSKTLTAEIFKAEYSNPSYDTDFLYWMENEIKIKKDEVGTRRIIKYKTILNKLKEFRQTIYFSEIDHFFINSFKGWCRTTKGNDINTINSNLAVIKHFTGRALKKKLIEFDPFEEIKIGRGAPDRVYCEEDELKNLWNLYNNWENSGKSHQKIVLRHFLFMCFTGLRISDFISVKHEDINHGMLRFYPMKTRSKKKQLVTVPLNDYALLLLSDEGTKKGLLFHPISEQRMNANLKDIAKMAGINKPLSNHTGRHTFATLFLQKTHDVATLQKLLGHSRIEETMVYVHITENDLSLQIAKWTKDLDLKN